MPASSPPLLLCDRPRPVPPDAWLRFPVDAPVYLAPADPLMRELDLLAWERARRSLEEEDVLWYFDNGPEQWRQHCGRRGYAVVRDRVIIDAILAGMN